LLNKESETRIVTIMVITRKIFGEFMVDELYLNPFPRTLPLSHSVNHTRFPSCKKILQLWKWVIRAPVAALSVNEPVKAVGEKLVALSVTTGAMAGRNLTCSKREMVRIGVVTQSPRLKNSDKLEVNDSIGKE